MRAQRILAALAATAAVLGALAFPAGAAEVNSIIVADAGARAFTLRPSYDAGGAAPLSLYIGYAEANVSTPEPQADGQASWYNLNIIETALFQDPENCTPAKNVQATLDGVNDAKAWASDYLTSAIQALSKGSQPPIPEVPSVRHACTERFPGFAQSRYPATGTIPQQARDDLLTKPLCKYACDQWTTLRKVTSPIITDGSFSSAASDKPTDESVGAMTNLGDGTLISIALAQTRASATLVGKTLTVESDSNLAEVCIGRTAVGCQLYIDEIRQHALVRRTPGAKPVTENTTTISGLRRLGANGEEDILPVGENNLPLGKIPCCYQNGTNELNLQFVSKSLDCVPVGNSSAFAVADAGGLRIYGKSGSGGGIMIGGACARARISEVDEPVFVPPAITPPQILPGHTTVIPGSPGMISGGNGGLRYGQPRIVTREAIRYVMRRPLAWRTVAWWGSFLGAFAALTLGGVVLRNTAPVRPIARRVDSFSRQFLRG